MKPAVHETSLHIRDTNVCGGSIRNPFSPLQGVAAAAAAAEAAAQITAANAAAAAAVAAAAAAAAQPAQRTAEAEKDEVVGGKQDAKVSANLTRDGVLGDRDEAREGEEDEQEVIKRRDLAESDEIIEEVSRFRVFLAFVSDGHGRYR